MTAAWEIKTEYEQGTEGGPWYVRRFINGSWQIIKEGHMIYNMGQWEVCTCNKQ